MEEMRSLQDLLDLQAEDSTIDRLLERRQSLPELEAYRDAHDRVSALEAELEGVRGRIREAELGVDKADGELQIADVKLQQEERRLYAGGLSARDAEHLRQEVEMLRRQISEREDLTIELMEQREAADGEAKDLGERIAAVGAEKSGHEAAIAAAWKEIDAEIAVHEARKTDIAPLIPADLMELYDELRPIKEGVAAGRLADGTCGGCHLKLSAAEQAQILREHPPRCIHCRRILVP